MNRKEVCHPTNSPFDRKDKTAPWSCALPRGCYQVIEESATYHEVSARSLQSTGDRAMD